ncbi:hypothetical protein [Pandoraea sp. SD6-2]|uniref:hypothetical protein n=1 Tax=Pandoraea sp. SD6-2 TaxID=1286093 RepID=UPI00032EBD37|nr:hypothetical protein [Pandoraea sp. SD6-2]EON11965.1 hypothetical protein C266_17356 [Pandoraea sp. SD6-2]
MTANYAALVGDLKKALVAVGRKDVEIPIATSANVADMVLPERGARRAGQAGGPRDDIASAVSAPQARHGPKRGGIALWVRVEKKVSGFLNFSPQPSLYVKGREVTRYTAGENSISAARCHNRWL